MSTVPQHQLNALVDHQLPSREREAVLAGLAADPDDAQTLAAWQTQREQLRELNVEVMSEVVPPELLLALNSDAMRPGLASFSWQRWGGMAAAVLLSFSAGWLAHSMGWPASEQLASNNAPRVPALREFVHSAELAHVAYAPEVRHPVEVAANQQEHLVQWLSKRLGHPLRVPVLGSQGFELVGGRLLPGDGAVRAQFMFQDAAGTRLTLYIGAVTAAGVNAKASAMAGRPDSKETAFSFSSDGPVPGFYWVDQGFGYALSGSMSRERLLDLAESVYRQQ